MKPADFDYVRNYVRSQAAIVIEPGKEYLVESRLTTLARKETSQASTCWSTNSEPDQGANCTGAWSMQ